VTAAGEPAIAVDPPPPPARSGLRRRLLTAAIGVPLILLLDVVGGWAYTLAVAVVLAKGYQEFARAARLGLTPLAVAGGVTVALIAPAAHLGGGAAVGLLAAGVAASLLVLILAGEPPASLVPWAYSLAGILYVGGLGYHVAALHLVEDGRDWVLLAIFTTFATDTGAFAAGRLFGRHKLAPRLSPAKTVEGAVGGLLAGALAAWGLGTLLDLDPLPLVLLAYGAAAGVAAILGDLSESLLKRCFGVKDMGTIVPGHGGILDRLDSLLFVMPLTYYISRWTGA
jgi:phosphatidate cytidylyltransferase